MKYSLNVFDVYLIRVLVLLFLILDLVIIFIIDFIRVLVVKNVGYLSFIFVFPSTPLINNFHQPSSVASYFIGCLLDDLYVFESFLSLHHLVANLVKNVDERGRNIMCVRTLPSLLVLYYNLIDICLGNGTSEKRSKRYCVLWTPNPAI